MANTKKRTSSRKRRSTIPIWMSLLILVFMLCVTLVLELSDIAPIFTGKQEFEVSGGTMEIHMIDVGQADSILVSVPGYNILFDAGKRSEATEIITYLDALGVTELDCVVFTHSDSDHIGGGAAVIEKYEVGEVFMEPYDYGTPTKTYSTLHDTIVSKGIPIVDPTANAKYERGDNGDLKIKVLGPVEDYKDKNEDSIVMRLDFGSTSLLMTGDAGKEAELDILNTYSRSELDCDILKVGHHGSKTSSCEEFLKVVTPEYALISSDSEDGNDYGHPHLETLSALESIGAQIYRTDTLGSIVLVTDGETITLKEKP